MPRASTKKKAIADPLSVSLDKLRERPPPSFTFCSVVFVLLLMLAIAVTLLPIIQLFQSKGILMDQQMILQELVKLQAEMAASVPRGCALTPTA